MKEIKDYKICEVDGICYDDLNPILAKLCGFANNIGLRGMELTLITKEVRVNESGDASTIFYANIKKGEKKMPLVKGKAARSKKGFSENVRREMHEGKPVKQATAIAYSVARQSKKKSSKRGK